MAEASRREGVMVTRDEARWNLIEATKEYARAQRDIRAVEITPEDFLEVKDLLTAISPLTLSEVRERLERFDRAWNRYRAAWENLLRFVGP
jgi:hypothetical protein